jgi:diguanylate cyclase (GGDEF)-like protein
MTVPMGWIRRHSFLPIVALLAVAALVVTQLSRARAVDNYEAQAALADVRGQLSELQILPWTWAMLPDSPQTPDLATAQLEKFDRAVHARLFEARGRLAGVDFDAVHARVDANLAATKDAARFATSDDFKRMAATGTSNASMSDLLALARLPMLAERQGETYRRAALALKRTQDAYAAHATSKSHQASLISASAILVLLGAFAWFYRRSVAARSRAEALAAEVEELLTHSRREALTDQLTGLPNRRAALDELAERLAAGGETLLVMFDLDGFKVVNDSFGHPAGDALLRRLADKLTEEIGDRGTAYRLGGDEFCVIAPLVGDAIAVVEDARTALSECGPGYEVVSSVGVALLPREATSVSAALATADARLYEDKRRRRRRTGRALERRTA